MTSPRKIELPLTKDIAGDLRAGEYVLLSGTLYTARDAAHKRLVEALERGEQLPFPPEGATIYYTGPTPAPPG
ncbi:fumarate hydratase C-terminal domain-containing protein, partial [bacterium]|nr:fumarate hydratase C-terminal domain-containing protein [bacterium]